MLIVAFFNNKGGVGKTTLVYHLAWMFADLGLTVVAADLDPQSNLSSMFLDENRLVDLWPENKRPRTIMGSLTGLIEGVSDVDAPYIEPISDNIGLLVGDLGLARVEDELSDQWPKCLDGQPRAFRVMSAFHRILDMAGRDYGADIVLADVGPNLGAINRTALIAANYVVVPLAPDLFSLQGLRNLGPTLRIWRKGWKDRRSVAPDIGIKLPTGEMTPVGYVLMQHAVRYDRPVKAYGRWAAQIPNQYKLSLLDEPDTPTPTGDDPNCLALLKHYRSLMPMAMEAHKPMFFLRPADGAIGAHSQAVRNCYDDFETLAKRIASAIGVKMVEN